MIIPGQTAVITAGAHGIGRSVADLLARRGMNVVIADIDGAAAPRAAAEPRAAGGAAVGLACDVRDEADLEQVRLAGSPSTAGPTCS
ncbi:SDR family NAD(P)-dependent oxidoreductase [Streptomyces sp. DSM 41524]|uniref:SDR family NAD(P)-dependent oxidoreductase n=1 Tax=Streptomyces asiaticus subsp. ignotus TaxID=3098222 RepID=A0ABU7QC24_9ACTN|nr:SDR family NAD(P)-dependent oxidoreductase [Streptomyces sp. DSM 41524]